MNLDELHRRLLEAGRIQPPSEAVPYAFEKRIMARLCRPIAFDPWIFWNRILWRAAAPCLAIMLLAGAYSWIIHQGDRPESLGADLELAVSAPLQSGVELW